MIIADNTLNDVNTKGGGITPPCTGIKSDALPEVQKTILAENSHTGVSTKNALSGTVLNISNKKSKNVLHWYALRATYGREKKAYDYLVDKKVEAFYPTITNVKVINGKKKNIVESRLPNIFFARGTEDEIKSYVYDNVNLSYLRFYYRKVFSGRKVYHEPLIVPSRQMESFRIICNAEAKDIIVTTEDVQKFKEGQMVRVIDGDFKGVIGVVARHQGQQRVGIVIEGLLTVATAYIPSAFLERVLDFKEPAKYF